MLQIFIANVKFSDHCSDEGEGSVICLGVRNDKVDAAVEVICENNCY